MFNVALDKDNFFTGNYATVGTVENGVFVNELPPSGNKQLFYHLTEKEVVKTKEVPEKVYIKYTNSETETINTYYDKDGIQLYITDEEYNNLSEEERLFIVINNKTDEEGNIIYKTVEYTEIIKEWVYDEEKYNIFINEKAQKEAEDLAKKEEEEKAEKEKAEEIANLKSALEEQKEFSNSMFFTLDSLLTDVIPSLMEGSEVE